MNEQVVALYEHLIQSWNDRNAKGMASLFTEDGESIGFDGSQSVGRKDIYEHLYPIFESHPTAPFVVKVKEVHELGSGVQLLRAIAGMIPPGETDLKPEMNTHHTIVVVKEDGQSRIKLFQNTPAQFHGRPECVEQMTEELRQEIKSVL